MRVALLFANQGSGENMLRNRKWAPLFSSNKNINGDPHEIARPPLPSN